jgi:ribosomal protein S18 acetylase RimI-like enzyme
MSTDSVSGDSGSRDKGTPKMEFVSPDETDWREFLALAGAEGWRVPTTELALLRGPLADSVLGLRCHGRFAGLVSFVHHGASAWIGNLIIRPEWRGQGFGKHLFEEALGCLAEKKAASVWLTASEAGYPLYQRRGFETVGRVERWVRKGQGGALPCRPAGERAEEDRQTAEALRRADTRAWGGRRMLLDHLLKTGRSIACGGSIALLQREPGLRILGPWYGTGDGEEDHRQLLALAIASANAGEDLAADVLVGTLAPQVLREVGFTLHGGTRLMVRGNADGIDLNRIVSFASLGSMG